MKIFIQLELVDSQDFQLNKFFYKQVSEEIIDGLIDCFGQIKIGLIMWQIIILKLIFLRIRR